MAQLSHDIMEPFREIYHTNLDNFTEDDKRESVAYSRSLRRILESAKQRHLQSIDDQAQ